MSELKRQDLAVGVRNETYPWFPNWIKSNSTQLTRLRSTDVLRSARLILLAGFCVCFLTGCVANIVAYYRSFGDPSTVVPVFEPDLNIPKHAPFLASTIRDLAEFSDQTIGAVTTMGSLMFDSQWNVVESATFPQSYLDVAIIQTKDRLWVYAESHPIEDKSENWYFRDYHIYEFGTTTPTFTYSCSSSSAARYKGRPVVDLSGEAIQLP